MKTEMKKNEYSTPQIEEITLIVTNQILDPSGTGAGGGNQGGEGDDVPIG